MLHNILQYLRNYGKSLTIFSLFQDAPITLHAIINWFQPSKPIEKVISMCWFMLKLCSWMLYHPLIESYPYSYNEKENKLLRLRKKKW